RQRRPRTQTQYRERQRPPAQIRKLACWTQFQQLANLYKANRKPHPKNQVGLHSSCRQQNLLLLPAFVRRRLMLLSRRRWRPGRVTARSDVCSCSCPVCYQRCKEPGKISLGVAGVIVVGVIWVSGCNEGAHVEEAGIVRVGLHKACVRNRRVVGIVAQSSRRM